MSDDTTCHHTWVAGMMYVHSEDLLSVHENRPIECENCETVFDPEKHDPYDY